MRKKTGPPVWQDPAATLEHEVPKDSCERAEDTSILSSNAEGEALLNIISKLFEERTQFEEHSSKTSPHVYRTIQDEDDSLGYFWDFFDLCQHVVRICPFCNSVKPRRENRDGKDLA